MGTVPAAYFEFAMHYAPFFYVIPTNMAIDPPADQKQVTVLDGSKFQAGFPVEVKDSAHGEWNEVDSVLGNIVTLKNNLVNTYYVGKGGLLECPDPAFIRGSFAASFAIEFLYEAYAVPQFVASQIDILTKMRDIADWLLTHQCIDISGAAFGGFRGSETATDQWIIDTGCAIPILLKTYCTGK